MRIADVLGNPLVKGDSVNVLMNTPLIGKIVDLQDGGLSLANVKGEQTPAVVVIEFRIALCLDPAGQQILNIVKVVNPEDGAPRKTGLLKTN